MVQGIPSLKRRFKQVPVRIERAVEQEIARSAEELVRLMMAQRPIPEITVGWTWGRAPKGAVQLARSGATNRAGLRATIFAIGGVASKGFETWRARWFEFGTAPRIQETTGRYVGQIRAQPFFYPTFRSNRRRIRGRITRAVRKAAQQS